MNQTKQFSFFPWLRQNILLLISTGAALCLFLTPAKITILLEIAIFLLVSFWCLICGPSDGADRSSGLSSLLAAVFSGIGFFTFYTGWTHSSIMAAVAGLAHLPVPILVAAVGILGAAVAFYAFRRLARWMENRIIAFLPEAGPDIRKNLKANWFFPLSAAVFFAVETNFTATYHMGFAAAVAMMILITARIPSMAALIRNMDRRLSSLCFLSALGICLSEQVVFGRHWGSFSPAPNPLTGGLWILAALASFPFVFLCTAVFGNWLWQQLRKAGLFQRMDQGTWFFCAGLLLLLICAAAAVFLNTDGFYGTPHRYDIIYTSDSPILVGNDSYLALAYSENDLRQPLYALFSAPFMGIPALIRQVLSLSGTGNAILMNCMQLVVLVLTLVMLSDMLELTGKNRIAFLLLGAFSYPFGLFCLMMEQYIFAVFYLVLTVYLLQKKIPSRTALWGAGGTLLTSVILLPTLCQAHPLRSFRSWFRQLCSLAIEFVVVLIAFSRLDIILDVSGTLEKMSQFSGSTLTWADRIFRYTQFVRSCVFAPAAEVTANPAGAQSWQLVPASAPDFIGIAILVLCVISMVLNRRSCSARIAGGWVVFSLVILLGLGWGASENGQILYALYFGWAFLVLLYQLVVKAAQLLKLPGYAATTAIALVMAAVNLPALWDMIRFALTHYPL